MVQSINTAGISAVLTVLFRRPHLLLPHIRVQDIRQIPFKDLKANGIDHLIFDKDNCLTAPYSLSLHKDFEGSWNECLRVFSPENITIVSNSAGTPDDRSHQAERIARGFGVRVLRHSVKKPLCGDEIRTVHSRTAVIGDRLATDVLLANLNGMLSIWTRGIVTTEGDNLVARCMRSLEHCAYDFMTRNGVTPPSHPVADAINGKYK